MLTGLIDRWRRGPELRAAQEAIAQRDHAIGEARELIRRMQEEINSRNGHLHLLGELLRTTKARCATCGSLVWNWVARLVDCPGDRPILQAPCETCQRAEKREQERAAKAAEVAEAPVAAQTVGA